MLQRLRLWIQDKNSDSLARESDAARRPRATEETPRSSRDQLPGAAASMLFLDLLISSLEEVRKIDLTNKLSDRPSVCPPCKLPKMRPPSRETMLDQGWEQPAVRYAREVTVAPVPRRAPNSLRSELPRTLRE
jgi:hypothetical protein